MNLKRMDEKVMGLETLVCVGYGLKIRRERERMVVILECCGRKSIINICLYLAGVAVKDAAATSVCLLHYHYSILILKNKYLLVLAPTQLMLVC